VLVSCINRQNHVTVVSRDASLYLLSNKVVVDIDSGLMWSSKDNGENISIQQAKKYIAEFRLAGYKNWRIPTISELETLHLVGSNNDTPPGPGCSGDYDIHPFISLSCCCPWALQDNGTRAASFPFITGIANGTMWHHKSGRSGNRILPVRNLDAGWKPPD